MLNDALLDAPPQLPLCIYARTSFNYQNDRLAPAHLLRYRMCVRIDYIIGRQIKLREQLILGIRGLRRKMSYAFLKLYHKIRRFHFQNKRFRPRIFGPVQNITVSPKKNGLTPDLVKNETVKLEKSEFWGLKGT